MAKLLWLSVLILIGAAVFTFWEEESPNLAFPPKIISQHEDVEKYLTKYKEVIGADYEAYKNHIYRVLTYTVHFLNGDESNIRLIGPALVYHDLGLWSDAALAYLEPSVDLAKKDLKKSFSTDELRLIQDIIYWHHKITPFTGKNEEIVNAVRKGDWIDATKGLITKGMPRAHIRKIQDTIPNAGFHKTLLEFGPRLRGWNIYKIVTELGSIMKW